MKLSDEEFSSRLGPLDLALVLSRHLHERVVLRGAEGRGPVARRLTRPCEALLGRSYAVPQMHEGWPCLKCTKAARSLFLFACP